MTTSTHGILARHTDTLDVEAHVCPSGGNHKLTNTRAGKTRCAGCRQPWWVLDQQLRGAK